MNLQNLVDDHLAIAREHTSGRSAVTVHGGREHHLRQTLIALAGGRSLGEHENPGEATLQVLVGRVRLAGAVVPRARSGSGGVGAEAVLDVRRGPLGRVLRTVAGAVVVSQAADAACVARGFVHVEELRLFT